MRELPAVYVVPAHAYSEVEALAILRYAYASKEACVSGKRDLLMRKRDLLMSKRDLLMSKRGIFIH